jgi:uncharacterized membrane protein YGL010W
VGSQPTPNSRFTQPFLPAQAILTAPFFVWFELLFMLGYYKDLNIKVEEMIVEVG